MSLRIATSVEAVLPTLALLCLLLGSLACTPSETSQPAADFPWEGLSQEGIEPPLLVIFRDHRSILSSRLASQLAGDAAFEWAKHLLTVDSAAQFAKLSGDPVPVDLQSRILNSPEFPPDLGYALGVNARGRILVVSQPPTPRLLLAMLALLASDHDESVQRQELVEALREHFLNAIDIPRLEYSSLAIFDVLCLACPSGEEYQRIVRDAHSLSQKWVVLVPSSYRSLIATAGQDRTDALVVGYDAGDDDLQHLLSLYRILGGQMPVRWEVSFDVSHPD